MMKECHETKVSDRLTLEVSVYEDGYVFVSLVDEFGWEIASADGTAYNGNTAGLVSALKDVLVSQYGE